MLLFRGILFFALTHSEETATLYLEYFQNRNTMGFSQTIKALADPTRREILFMLKAGRLSAGEISEKLESLTAPTVSYHLSQLKKASLITETKYKNFIYYNLNASVFEEIMLWCTQFTGETEHETQE
jgi:DNA-binding transcriptional ArsR family regulator